MLAPRRVQAACIAHGFLIFQAGAKFDTRTSPDLAPAPLWVIIYYTGRPMHLQDLPWDGLLRMMAVILVRVWKCRDVCS